MIRVLAISLGAAVGANLRYFFGLWVSRYATGDFPWGTFFINLSGSFLIGLVAALSIGRGWGQNATLFVTVGALGGFTTFSAFSNENLGLLQKGRYDLLLLNALGSVLLGLLLAWLGYLLAQRMLA